MTSNELHEIIQKIDSDNSLKDATFGIFKYGDPIEYCIKANSGGLKLFAVELLIAAHNFEYHEKKECHQLELPDWVDESSDIVIDYVEPVPNFIAVRTYEPTWKDKLSDFGCLLVAGILIVSILIGLKTIFTWLFL